MKLPEPVLSLTFVLLTLVSVSAAHGLVQNETIEVVDGEVFQLPCLNNSCDHVTLRRNFISVVDCFKDGCQLHNKSYNYTCLADSIGSKLNYLWFLLFIIPVLILVYVTWRYMNKHNFRSDGYFSEALKSLCVELRAVRVKCDSPTNLETNFRKNCEMSFHGHS